MFRAFRGVVLAGVGCLGVACSTGAAGGTAAPEVAETTVKLDLPAVPEFVEPKPHGDGTHTVLEMRRRGKKFLDQDVKVKAYVVWVYDCATALGPQVIKDTPEKCDRPHFRLGDTADAREDQTITVVDVPRGPRDDEKRVLPKEEVAAMKAAVEAMPPLTPGTMVLVEGKWSVKSPKGFMNTDGLLVYGRASAAQ